MFAKIEIRGIIEVVTGLHIGGSTAFSAIGAVDSPVVKDSLTNLPLIPGSSLKGKMRTLLAKQYNETVAKNPNQDHERIRNLFGSSAGETMVPGRLLFSDAVMSNWEDLKKRGLTSRTEVKFENTINRMTAVANPRQIERVVRGSEFPLEMVYEVKAGIPVEEDFRLIKDGLLLLEYDYLGGNGSRGYGKIKFRDLTADVVVGELDEDTMEACRAILEGR